MAGNVRVKTKIDEKKVMKTAEKANFENLAHAAAAIRLTARHSIRRSPKQSSPGSPPHTRAGLLKQAILYAVEKQKCSAVIGPSAEVVGTSGHAHEFGGRYKKQIYPKRPFMGPALMENFDWLPRFWAGSVK